MCKDEEWRECDCVLMGVLCAQNDEIDLYSLASTLKLALPKQLAFQQHDTHVHDVLHAPAVPFCPCKPTKLWLDKLNFRHTPSSRP